jgi:Ring finger domain
VHDLLFRSCSYISYIVDFSSEQKDAATRASLSTTLMVEPSQDAGDDLDVEQGTRNEAFTKYENQCAICLEFYLGESEVAYNAHDKSCRHLFHVDCILSWLMKRQDCPCCRRQFISLEQAMQSIRTIATGEDSNVSLADSPSTNPS